MHLEFESTDEVVSAQISRLVIIRVINLDFEHFLLLKVEIDHDFGDEFGAQIVMDNFGLADLLPHLSRLFEKHNKGIR